MEASVAAYARDDRTPRVPTGSDAGSPTTSDGLAFAIALAAAVVAGLGAGFLTAYAQGWLSDSTTSLANSAGPWSLLAFAVARSCRRLMLAAVVAVVTLACCELGYVLATEVRGGSNASSTVVFWLTAALLAGPPLGIAGAWSTRTDWRRGVGFGVVGGVLIGEAWYGWTTVAATTDWRYWAVELAIGVAIVAATIVLTRRVDHAAAVVGTAALTAIVVFATARMF